MASITVDRVWLTLASDTSRSVSLLKIDGQNFGDAIQGEVRSYAAGRERLISTPTRKKGVQVPLATKPADYALLEEWAGQLVLYRDEYGIKMWGVFLEAPWRPMLSHGTDWRQVDLTIQRVTYSEAV